MTTYLIQAQLTDAFEDLYVEAATVADAIKAARVISTLYRDAGRLRGFVAFVA